MAKTIDKRNVYLEKIARAPQERYTREMSFIQSADYFFSSWYKWLARYILVQLFLTLISLPFLIYAGLSFTPASFLGNIVFVPFITVSLALSFFIFFTQLLGLPNSYSIKALEWVTDWWLSLADLFTSIDSFVFAVPPFSFFIIGILLSFTCVAAPYSLERKAMLLFLLMLSLCTSMRLFAPIASDVSVISCGKKNLLVICLRGQLLGLALDPIKKSERTLENWSRYTLRPYLIKRYGKQSLDTCIAIQRKKNNQTHDAFAAYLVSKRYAHSLTCLNLGTYSSSKE